MVTYVTERPQTVEAPAVLEDAPDVDRGALQAEVGRLPSAAEWRWVPDREDVDLPTPPARRGPRPSGPVLMALAWASVH